ncbi:MAG: aspartate aminotransferase family protein [Lentisphaeria bacterium]|nr:aspartate aminotransferase family protein [Lentisphaeria bacterium]MDY0175481.1 aspartate aminotransferase family protein [Lentisphaeria bacterium]
MKETLAQLLQLDRDFVLPTYGRELMLVRGEGSRVWDYYGNEYLDFGMGISVCNLGHCHPAVTAAIQEQAARLVHCSNLYHNELQARLAAVIAGLSFGGKVFFCNSGAEANEGMIKFARRWGSRNGARSEIICASHCFHGRTLATLAATATAKYREGFAPDMGGFVFATYNDLQAVRDAINSNTVAVMVEPVQGEGGVHPASKEFLQGLRQLCDEKNLLLLLDEVQTGMGRCGHYFAYENFGIVPDAISLAKALGNGFPMGAFVIRSDYASLFAPGVHGSTFGGTPLACAASLAVFRTMEEENVIDNVRQMSRYLFARLEELKREFAMIKEVRGLGLLIGLQIGDKVKELQKACLDQRLLVLTAGEGVLRMLPSLKVSREEIDQACQRLRQALLSLT